VTSVLAVFEGAGVCESWSLRSNVIGPVVVVELGVVVGTGGDF